MRRFQLAVIFLMLLFSPLGLNAATGQFTITKDPQAVAVAQKALAAMGGAQALLTYQDSQATGTLTLYTSGTSVGYPITLKCKGTQETRVEVQTPKGTNVRIMNQGQAVIERPDGTIRNLSLSNTMAERVNHIPLLSILGEYQGPGTSVQYQGSTQVNGQSTDIIAVSLIPANNPAPAQSLTTMTQTLFFVDQTSGLVDKIQYTNYAEDDPSSTQIAEVYFSDYRIISGISVPFHQTMYTDGNLDTDIVLQAVSFNNGLADAEFALPGVANVQ